MALRSHGVGAGSPIGRSLPDHMGGWWFAKVHALGNDFVWVLDASSAGELATWCARAPSVCARHTGIGADGVVLWNGVPHDPELWFVNADGSVAEMCGNALRAVAVGGRELGLFAPGRMHFRSGGESFPVVLGERGAPTAAGLGIPRFHPDAGSEELLSPSNGPIAHLSLPNPHVVVFGTTHEQEPEVVARACSRRVDGGANVGFARVDGESIDLRVWERGVGWTMACGSGAAAAGVAAMRLGLITRGSCEVRQPGGTLAVWIDDEGRAWIEGDAAFVYVGSTDPLAHAWRGRGRMGEVVTEPPRGWSQRTDREAY